MATAALFEPAITQLVAEGRDAMYALRDAEAKAQKLEKLLGETREAAQMRRMEMGTLLLRVRDTLPKRGTKEHGWRAYLEAIELDETTAWRYMNLAKNPSTAFQEGDLKRNEDQVREITSGDIPPPTDDDAPPPEASPDEPVIDRDTWCTPVWITDAIGEWDLDPCANDRSHVQATQSFDLELHGQDGLELAASVMNNVRVFLNPPYSDVTPWIEAYKHTRFCFLLKLDPSTKWFEALFEHTGLILIPRGTRVQFEAPEGVPADKALANQFPHALFFAHEEDASDAIRNLCFCWRTR